MLPTHFLLFCSQSHTPLTHSNGMDLLQIRGRKLRQTPLPPRKPIHAWELHLYRLLGSDLHAHLSIFIDIWFARESALHEEVSILQYDVLSQSLRQKHPQ